MRIKRIENCQQKPTGQIRSEKMVQIFFFRMKLYRFCWEWFMAKNLSENTISSHTEFSSLKKKKDVRNHPLGHRYTSLTQAIVPRNSFPLKFLEMAFYCNWISRQGFQIETPHNRKIVLENVIVIWRGRKVQNQEEIKKKRKSHISKQYENSFCTIIYFAELSIFWKRKQTPTQQYVDSICTIVFLRRFGGFSATSIFFFFGWTLVCFVQRATALRPVEETNCMC